MLDLATADDREDVWSLLHDVCERDACGYRAFLGCNLGQLLADAPVLIILRPLVPAFLLVFFCCSELAATQGAPGYQTQTLGLTHWQNLSFKVSESTGPMALVDTERGKAVEKSIWAEILAYRRIPSEHDQEKSHRHSLHLVTTQAGVPLAPR